MSRVEKFKQKRILRKRYISAALLFFFILISGIICVDYATNYFMNGNHGIAFTDVICKKEFVEIKFMNHKLYINTQYINRDMEKLKGKLQELFGT